MGSKPADANSTTVCEPIKPTPSVTSIGLFILNYFNPKRDMLLNKALIKIQNAK